MTDRNFDINGLGPSGIPPFMGGGRAGEGWVPGAGPMRSSYSGNDHDDDFSGTAHVPGDGSGAATATGPVRSSYSGNDHDGVAGDDPRQPRGHRTLSERKHPTNRFTVEGPRGASTRASVWLRYVAYFVTIVICSGITSACFAQVPGATSGGEWMLLCVAFQLAIASIGSWMFANRRPEINQQVRSYIFGYTLFPGTGIAILMWSARHLTAGPTGTDVFVNSLNSALPWLYFLPIILPAVIFLKTVAGMRMIHREQMDDQEIMRTYTRNDGRQR